MSLQATTFRDAVAMRLGRLPPDPLPRECPSCGEPFSLDHALSCHKGGWVRRRHGEVERAWTNLFKKITPSVVEEPLLGLTRGLAYAPHTTTDPDARADIMVRGLFEQQKDAYFDVTVVDTGSVSRRGETSAAVLREAERGKRRKYDERVRPLGSFTPLASSVYGKLAPEAETVLMRVVSKLKSNRRERTDICFLHRVGLQVATIKATSLCLRARTLKTLPECDVPTMVEDGGATVGDLALWEEREAGEPEMSVRPGGGLTAL
jgi:hypothetical protein